MQHNDYILTLACPDTTGIVYHVSGFLFERGCNILDSQQFGDEDTKLFFLRVHFSVPDGLDADTVRKEFAAVGERFSMQWQIRDPHRRARVLLMVSKHGHCLNDLLFRAKSGQLPIDIPAVVSNHPDFALLSASYGVPFYHLPVAQGGKEQQERQVLQIAERENVDLVVLARYMQILSPEMCRALAGRAINIHHSFLPSFKGARPYYQAHDRGVKLIGATAHYVTPDLDEGPIIEQDIARVDHSMSPETLTQVGRDVECLVLARAVRWHVEHRILLNGHKTIVFA
ncbi:formyltetrahydrofolate deformylase [Pigmentiphaga sp. GD03639]|uniref:formyltetrahydrofolate deformylase n=1 Tax=unclassified Pigmentiphaga TaxID=2626614 RepID=UPI000B40BE82|nr:MULTISPECIES: formyltetrahydrofolate deformylase [unclassified Pigmentiphaga]MDH2237058.1 formyltetrahydrofolate deformylase [Pigmentiphaga sp. GD03639]OVZ65882.1 formyltetrahydrofolate deformylase [Pigmentiphaga sp. NML030171]